jgi:hypothetical protein
MGALEDIVQRLGVMKPEELAKVSAQAMAGREKLGMLHWMPTPGPQTDAYRSLADVLLYGGQAGGGKSHLELGIGVNEAHTGIIFRRELTQTDGLEREGKSIIGGAANFNGSDLEWTWPDGKSLKLGGIRGPDDWMAHAGRERDYMAFDEGGEFLEIQVASLVGWLRAPPGRRTRVVIGSNPPRTAEGIWLMKWFAPWLDKTFANPARPGELRWAVYVSDANESRMVWVDAPGEYEIKGETYTAKSYTFIPASLEDNPYRNTPEYRAQLQSLPEPLRSQLLYGDFGAGMKDGANQCIPASWVRAAIDRWKAKPDPDVPMCAIGVDCSGGGDDQMVQAPRYDGWFAPLIKTPGKSIPQDKAGAFSAGLVLSNRRDKALIIVDMGGGYGGPLFEHLKDNDIDVTAYKGAESTNRRSSDGKLHFTNKRSAAYWGFREALDPGQPGGSPIALPNDPRLIAGLTCPTFEVTANGIKVEPKVVRDSKGKVKSGVMAKLGFSPDEADAVVMAWFEGPKETTSALEWIEQAEQRRSRGMGYQVVSSHTRSGRQPLSARARA